MNGRCSNGVAGECVIGALVGTKTLDQSEWLSHLRVGLSLIGQIRGQFAHENANLAVAVRHPGLLFEVQIWNDM